jgi:hypothetical protein
MPKNRRRAEDDLAREDYRDPTAGFAGAPPARSALTLRLILASFGRAGLHSRRCGTRRHHSTSAQGL